MKLQDAKALAQDLMRQHGLTEKGWYFAFDSSVRRFGACHWRTNKITLSEKLTTLNDETRVRQTLLHEIAHALAGPKAHHNDVWRAICVRIGGDGQRLYTEANTVTVGRKVTGTCPNCKRVIKRHRRSAIACGQCCRKYNGNKYSEKYKIVWAR